MKPNAPAAVESSDECFRCGYNLHGIADDKPCPECGLLAERSRHVTDELHNTRPRWLKRLALGIWLIPVAPVLAVAWLAISSDPDLIDDWTPNVNGVLQPTVFGLMPVVGYIVAGAVLLLAAFLLTTPERIEAADRADRGRRIWLRICAAVPLLAILVWAGLRDSYERGFLDGFYALYRDAWMLIAFLLTVGTAPLPVLLFYQLRSLAKRARSAQLAEHCAIVGIGTSLSLLYFAAVIIVFELAERLDFGTYWIERSKTATYMTLLMIVAALLCVGWAIYILIRFAIAFYRAARQLREKWADADLAR